MLHRDRSVRQYGEYIRGNTLITGLVLAALTVHDQCFSSCGTPRLNICIISYVLISFIVSGFAVNRALDNRGQGEQQAWAVFFHGSSSH
ncbi:hypothetical protein F5I97DRAFT_1448524 [Phlebopus sp. FC_14]|nr:hypothetical protein F5I97DRAFT_1448524 [Phlebopus sp. FC_14]